MNIVTSIWAITRHAFANSKPLCSFRIFPKVTIQLWLWTWKVNLGIFFCSLKPLRNALIILINTLISVLILFIFIEFFSSFSLKGAQFRLVCSVFFTVLVWRMKLSPIFNIYVYIGWMKNKASTFWNKLVFLDPGLLVPLTFAVCWGEKDEAGQVGDGSTQTPLAPIFALLRRFHWRFLLKCDGGDLFFLGVAQQAVPLSFGKTQRF